MNIELESILPHRKPLLLINRIQKNHIEELVAEVDILVDTYGCELGIGVPSYFGIEYIAQSIAAYNGLNLQEKNSELSDIGFLVGVRDYKVETEHFKIGTILKVHIGPNVVSGNSGSFFGNIYSENDQLIASGTVITYKPTKQELLKLRAMNNE